MLFSYHDMTEVISIQTPCSKFADIDTTLSLWTKYYFINIEIRKGQIRKGQIREGQIQLRRSDPSRLNWNDVAIVAVNLNSPTRRTIAADLPLQTLSSRRRIVFVARRLPIQVLTFFYCNFLFNHIVLTFPIFDNMLIVLIYVLTWLINF
jgi:hypothetical protein